MAHLIYVTKMAYVKVNIYHIKRKHLVCSLHFSSSTIYFLASSMALHRLLITRMVFYSAYTFFCISEGVGDMLPEHKFLLNSMGIVFILV